MKKQIGWQKGAVTLFLIYLMLCGSLPLRAQDLIAVSDITGGSSVFVARARKPSSKNFTTGGHKRTVSQRAQTVKRVTRQVSEVARTAPQRVRVKTVEPAKIPANTGSMPKDKAAIVFAGVGEYYINQDDADNAVKFFREAVSLDQKNANAQNGLSDALALKGNQLLVAGKADLARALFEEAVKINPKNSGALYGLGEVLDELDKSDEAIANYEKALGFDRKLTEIYVPLGILYYQKGDIAKADDLLTKAAAAAPDDAETEYFLGLVRYAQNRNNESLTALQKALSGDQDNAEAHYYLGKVFLRLNRQTDALAEFKKASKLKSQYFEAFFDAGATAYELKDYAEAAADYKEAARYRNTDAQAFANLADAYRMTGDNNAAESNYDLALNFIARNKEGFSDDDIAAIYSNIAFVLGKQCEINRRSNQSCKWDKAIGSLEKAVKISPNPSDYANLGWAYYNAGKLDIAYGRAADGKLKLEKSRDASQKSIDANPSFIEAPLVNLGTTLIDLGDYKGAIDALKRAVAKRHDWTFAYYALGVAYAKNNDFANAVEPFRSAVNLQPNYVAALSGLGVSLIKTGNRKEAQKVIDKLKPLNPNEAKKLEAMMISMKK